MCNGLNLQRHCRQFRQVHAVEAYRDSEPPQNGQCRSQNSPVSSTIYLALLATAVSAPLCFGKGFIGNRLVKMMFDSGAEHRGGRDLFPNPLIRRNILDVGHSLKESRCFLCVVYLSGCHLIPVWRFSAHSESQ